MLINMSIKLQKAVISLNKCQRCTFQSQALGLCVLLLPGKTALFCSSESELLAENEFGFFNKPICYFCYIFLNVKPVDRQEANAL